MCISCFIFLKVLILNIEGALPSLILKISCFVVVIEVIFLLCRGSLELEFLLVRQKRSKKLMSFDNRMDLIKIINYHNHF